MKLINGDALEEMQKIESESIDLICTDLPYGTTQNKWDVIIPLNDMWNCFNRIIKPKGNIVLTATQPFVSKLIMSNESMYKYDIIWEKSIGSGQLNINRQPLRVHESILVFYKEFGTYNEQLGKGTPYSIKRKCKGKSNYGAQRESSLVNTGTRRAKSIVKIQNPRIKNGHPTQKPLDLMKYIIKTWSNENDVVLDCCMGFGTTGVASKELNRDFIGIEKEISYFDAACKRIEIFKKNTKTKMESLIEIE